MVCASHLTLGLRHTQRGAGIHYPVTAPRPWGKLLLGPSIVCPEQTQRAESTFATIILKPDSLESSKNILTESRTIIKHPKWRPELFLNDIALIEIPSCCSPYNNLYRIYLPIESTTKNGILYGWNKSTNETDYPFSLEKNHVHIIENEECSTSFGSLIRKTNICTNASYSENGCHGFSGGPLVVNGKIVGIVSFGTNICHIGYPTVHTRVSKYRKWIQKNSDVVFK
ncbi:hypothetical protein NQ317_014615 [Molorchus minor]|uniref:Peptidase S1 domain-containing protein n=1 Tax=Molorchus minor TaxID=1323400 RepID=A0ABQ9IQ43_9CUCU|nr:hypothetical protein NQ317_014615 [Molorchus minor]